MSETKCREVDERLADLAEGEAAASADLGEHVRGCAECSRNVEQARRAAKWIRRAGDEGKGARPEIDVAGVLRSADERRRARRRRVVAFAGGGIALAASIAAVAIVAVTAGEQPAGDAAGPTVAAAPDAPPGPAGSRTGVPAGPSGRIVAVRGPAGASVEVRDGSGRRLVAPGGDLPDLAPGAELSTDARTVAVVELTDGTRITLNRDTSLALDAAEADLLRVPRGEIVADVVARAAGRAPLRIAVPTGEIAVLGTKFGLAAEDDHCRVDVARGEVEVRAKDGRSARALAGEEAILSLEGAPTVTPVRDLSDLLEWAERLDEDEKAPRGLGSLRAYPPGRPERERPLSLDSHKVTVRVQGPYARTEVEEVFRNDTGETLEGVYRFPLPPGASVARLALDVDGRMEEGAFVESDRATKIWRGVIRQATPQERRRPREEFIWVAGPWKDPALLQWRKGNQFELRIFPIEANSSRRVAIAYTEVLRPVGNHRRYVYPLPFDEGGSTKAGRFSFEARLAGIDADKPVRSLGYDVRTGTDGAAKTASFEKDDFTATGDLVLDFALPARPDGLGATAYKPEGTADGYVLLSIRPDLPARGDPKPRDILIVVDSSYSAFGDRWARQAKLVRAIVDEMDRRDRVAVIACDVSCRRVGDPFGRPSSELAESVARDLMAIEPGDATDVGAAFEAAARELRDRRDAPDREARIVYIGDGVASVGEIDAGRLAQDVASTLAGLDARVTTVGVGTETDELVLAELARRGGGSHLAFAPGRGVRAEALAVLSAQYGASLEDPVLSLPEGLDDVEPRELPAVRAGDELLVLARAKGRVRGEATLRGKAAGRPYEQRYAIDIEPTDAPGNGFVPRLWAEARIAALTLKDAAANKDEIVRLSREHRTLSRFTSLLVLESEAMYRAFEVERPERVDDWTGEEPIREQMFGGLIANDEAGPPAERSDDATGWLSASRPGRGAPSRRPDSALVGSESLGNARTTGALVQRWVVRRWVDLSGPSEPSPSQRRRVEQLEKALDESPDSRDRHRALFLALSRVGDVDKALQVVEKWWARDRMDPEVLERMAEAEMARGRGPRAGRLLGSMVELAPRDAALHERLAAAFEAAGMDARACAHRRAIAAIKPADADVAEAAVRCLRRTGRDAAAERLVERFGNEMTRARLRAKIDRTPPAAPRRLSGDLVLEAEWDRSEDLELVIVHPDGRRSSWMGGVRGTSAKDASDARRESLALRRLRVGTYRIEIVRRGAPDGPASVAGSVRVRAPHESGTYRFTLGADDTRAPIATVRVTEQRVPPSWILRP